MSFLAAVFGKMAVSGEEKQMLEDGWEVADRLPLALHSYRCASLRWRIVSM